MVLSGRELANDAELIIHDRARWHLAGGVALVQLQFRPPSDDPLDVSQDACQEASLEASHASKKEHGYQAQGRTLGQLLTAMVRSTVVVFPRN